MSDLTTDAGIAAVQARLRGESDRLTDADLDAIEQRASQWASPLAIKCPSCGANPGDRCYGNGPMNRPHEQRREAVRQRVIDDVPALLAEVRRLRSIVTRWEMEAERAERHGYDLDPHDLLAVMDGGE